MGASTANSPAERLAVAIVVLLGLAGHASFAVADSGSAAEDAALARYVAAANEQDTVAAIGHLLDYSILAHGENAPRTALLTHRYGELLMRAGRHREATAVLKTALERSEVAFGEYSEESLDINMSLGYAYGELGRRRVYGFHYFDRALEILRARGERETIRYVVALLNIVSSVADNDGLSGQTTANIVDNDYSAVDGNVTNLQLDYRYRNDFDKVLGYLDEAGELARALADEDPFLSAKVAIARAKLEVLETADLASAPIGVRGRITHQTVVERNDATRDQLDDAMNVLSRDPESNSVFLAAANATLLDIAWLDDDRDRMLALCASGALDSSTQYTADRLFRITADGSVLAPEFGFEVPTNLFDGRFRPTKPARDELGERVAQPYFVPACINGELMAALVNAPRVIIEEFE